MGKERPQGVHSQWGWEALRAGPTGCCAHRKALEMSCAIENQLARILAEFELTLERDVLQPLSRLSEVTSPSQLPWPLVSTPPSH